MGLTSQSILRLKRAADGPFGAAYCGAIVVVVTVTLSFALNPALSETVMVQMPATLGVTLKLPDVVAGAVAMAWPELALGVHVETAKLPLFPACFTETA